MNPLVKRLMRPLMDPLMDPLMEPHNTLQPSSLDSHNTLQPPCDLIQTYQHDTHDVFLHKMRSHAPSQADIDAFVKYISTTPHTYNYIKLYVIIKKSSVSYYHLFNNCHYISVHPSLYVIDMNQIIQYDLYEDFIAQTTALEASSFEFFSIIEYRRTEMLRHLVDNNLLLYGDVKAFSEAKYHAHDHSTYSINYLLIREISPQSNSKTIIYHDAIKLLAAYIPEWVRTFLNRMASLSKSDNILNSLAYLLDYDCKSYAVHALVYVNNPMSIFEKIVERIDYLPNEYASKARADAMAEYFIELVVGDENAEEPTYIEQRIALMRGLMIAKIKRRLVAHDVFISDICGTVAQYMTE